jgi:hypothetical protein
MVFSTFYTEAFEPKSSFRASLSEYAHAQSGLKRKTLQTSTTSFLLSYFSKHKDLQYVDKIMAHLTK